MLSSRPHNDDGPYASGLSEVFRKLEACAFRRIGMEGMRMDAERFDGLVRSFDESRSRWQTLRGLAGAGALLSLLATKPVAAGKTGKPNNPGNSKPGKGPPGGS
jgi:hypothetical protein